MEMIENNAPSDDESIEPQIDVPILLRLFRLKQQYMSTYMECVDNRAALFDGITSLNEEEKDFIRPRILESTQRIAKPYAWGAWYGPSSLDVPLRVPLGALMEFGLTCGITGTVIVPIVVSFWLHGIHLSSGAVAFVALVLAFGLLSAASIIVEGNKQPIPWIFGVSIFFLIADWATLVKVQDDVTDFISDSVTAGMFGASVGCSLYLAAILICTLAASTIRRRFVRSWPVDDLIDLLCFSIQDAENMLKGESSQYREVQLFLQLDSIADRISIELPRKLTQQDDETNIWLKKRTLEMAVGVLQLKRLVLLGDAAGPEKLVKELTSRLMGTCSGNWSVFKPAEATVPISRAGWLRGKGRHLAAVATPIAIILVLYIYPDVLGVEASNSIKLASGAWLLSIALSWVDPGAGMQSDQTPGRRGGIFNTLSNK
jgi:hypothetical protein